MYELAYAAGKTDAENRRTLQEAHGTGPQRRRITQVNSPCQPHQSVHTHVAGVGIEPYAFD